MTSSPSARSFGIDLETIESRRIKADEVTPQTADYFFAQGALELSLQEPDRRRLRVHAVSHRGHDVTQSLKTVDEEGNPLSVLDLFYIPTETDDIDLIWKYGFDASAENILQTGLYFHDTLKRVGSRLKIILCRVVVGRALARDSTDTANISELPEGYDSVYIPGQSLRDSEDVLTRVIPFPAEAFDDVYLVYDKINGIVATHLIEFELLDSKSISYAKSTACGLCSFGRAVVHCVECAASFCRQCNITVHSDVVLAPHMRVSMSHLTADEENCPDHPETVMDRFCQACGIPVCIECKLRGDKHSGDACVFLTYDQVYQGVAQNLIDLNERRASLQTMLEQQEKTVTDLSNLTAERAAMFKTELVKYLQRYMMALQRADERKFEIARCISDIDRAKEFLAYHKVATDRVAFLSVWRNFDVHRSRIYDRIDACVTGADKRVFAEEAMDAKDVEIAELKRIIADKDRMIASLQATVPTPGAGRVKFSPDTRLVSTEVVSAVRGDRSAADVDASQRRRRRRASVATSSPTAPVSAASALEKATSQRRRRRGTVAV